MPSATTAMPSSTPAPLPAPVPAPVPVTADPFAIPGHPITPTLTAPRRDGSFDIDFVTQGYVVNDDNVHDNGALDLGTSEVAKVVEVRGERRWSTIADLARAADAAGRADGLVTAGEFAHFLRTFDTGDAGRAGTAGDGFLEGSELQAWSAAGLVPQSIEHAAALRDGRITF